LSGYESPSRVPCIGVVENRARGCRLLVIQQS
jgi:hypothetical protein